MKNLIIIGKGLWIGSTMTVPGVSGGTMAVITGIYEDLIHAVNGLLKQPVKNSLFLLKFLLGAGIGFLVFARFVTWLLAGEVSGELTRFFFAGVVAGGLPVLVSKSKITKIKATNLISIMAGVAIVLALSGIPQRLFYGGSGIKYILLQLAGGVLIAIALVLPGISASHMLYIMGLYELMIDHIYALEIVELMPLAMGVIAGTFLTTDILEKLMNKYTTSVYMVIIGFVAGSLVTLIPPDGIKHPVIDIALAAAGFAVMHVIRPEKNRS